MTGVGNLRLLDVDRLAEECADQTTRFFNRAEHEPGFCYELFRRAIVGRNSYAWEKIYHQYQFLVAKWINHHNGLPATGEDVDYFVNCAFAKMWSALVAEKFGQFRDVAGLLRYLQMCVNSVIVDHVRSNQTPTIDLEAFTHLADQDLPPVENLVTDRLERKRLWQVVASSTRDPKEEIVLKYTFEYDSKPSEIYAANPRQFESVSEVYQTKRNLINRLRRNPNLKQFLHA